MGKQLPGKRKRKQVSQHLPLSKLTSWKPTHTHSTRTPLESSRLQDPPKTKPVHNREQNLPIHGCTFLLVSCLICTVGTPSSFRTPNSSIALILWSQFHVRTQIKTKASNKSNHKNLYRLLRRPHILVAAKSRTTSMQEQELWAQLWPPGYWARRCVWVNLASHLWQRPLLSYATRPEQRGPPSLHATTSLRLLRWLTHYARYQFLKSRVRVRVRIVWTESWPQESKSESNRDTFKDSHPSNLMLDNNNKQRTTVWNWVLTDWQKTVTSWSN